MGGAHSRRKGHQFERDVAIIFRRIFPEARRQLEYHSADAVGVDIQGTGRFKIQCKKLKTYAPITKIFEIQCDEEFGDIPVLITAADRGKPMAVLPLENFVELVTLVEGYSGF